MRRLFDASGGNPFYGLELARALGRAGSEPSPGEPLPIPADLRGVLSARLAVLPDDVQGVLLTASCLQSPTTTTLERAMRAIARTTHRGEKAITTATPALGEHSQKRQLEKSVSWTGRERLRCLWYRLRLTVQEMNYATRRLVELQSRLP